VLISTTFPTADESGRIDNNFSGTTVVRNCNLIRSGGFDHDWAWRAAFQLCMDRRSISGVNISNVNIRDSFSDGLSIVAPGSKHGQGTLSNVRLENVNIPNYGIGTDSCHGLWVRNDACGNVTIINSRITDVQNSSTNFVIKKYTISDSINTHAPPHAQTLQKVEPRQEAQAGFGLAHGR